MKNKNNKNYKNNKIGFSIIEILIWIFVFSLWITWIFAIISSTLKINELNKNYIIASNLANEQIELVRNIRDSNYTIIKNYNQINPAINNYEEKFEYKKKYKIENNYSNTAVFPIKVEDITSWFEEWESKLQKMENYRLCIDFQNRYTYDCVWNIKTKFYKYISFEKVEYLNSWIIENIEDAYLLKSKVIWYINWYHEYEIKSIITDWKRL